jgi:hypothetical protein
MQNSDERPFEIKPIEGIQVTTSKGLVDDRLWKGGNQLYAKMNPSNCMWTLKYRAGAVPPSLKQTYTSFSKAYTAAKEYYLKRGLEVIEII